MITKKLIYRADDVGYTEAFDLGVYKAIEEGVITHADVMLDSPHTVEALKWLKDRPWISLGWHRHLWESPVLPAESVPHMVDDEGRFKWRHRHPERMNEVPYDEAYREFEAEYQLCLSVAGRPVSTAMCKPVTNELEKAFVDICNKYGVYHDLYDSEDGKIISSKEWKHLNLISRTMMSKPKKELFDLSNFDQYDYSNLILSTQWEYPQAMMVAGHTGYCDDHILQESSCSIHRCRELQTVISDEIKDWIIENHIELVSYTDLIEGKHTYQEYLKSKNSPLWIGNFKY